MKLGEATNQFSRGSPSIRKATSGSSTTASRDRRVRAERGLPAAHHRSGAPRQHPNRAAGVWTASRDSGSRSTPTNGDFVVSDKFAGVLDEFSPPGKYLGSLRRQPSPDRPLQVRMQRGKGEPPRFCHTHVNGVAFNSEGYLYIATGLNGVVDIFKPRPPAAIAYKPATNPTATSGTLNATVSPNGGGEIISCQFEYGTTTAYASGSIPCTPDPSGSHFSAPTDVHAEISGLTAETTYHYRVVVGNATLHQDRPRPDLHPPRRDRPARRSRHQRDLLQRHPEWLLRRQRRRHPLLVRIRHQPLLRHQDPCRRRPADAGAPTGPNPTALSSTSAASIR